MPDEFFVVGELAEVFFEAEGKAPDGKFVFGEGSIARAGFGYDGFGGFWGSGIASVVAGDSAGIVVAHGNPAVFAQESIAVAVGAGAVAYDFVDNFLSAAEFSIGGDFNCLVEGVHSLELGFVERRHERENYVVRRIFCAGGGTVTI